MGIKKIAWMNQALLAKTGWRLLQNDQGLLSHILNAKYLSCSSSVWRDVLYGAKLLPYGLQWRVGSGDNILFWTNSWLSCGPL